MAMVRAVGKKIFDLLSISLLHSPSLSLLSLALSSSLLSLALSLCQWGSSWVHPGPTLAWEFARAAWAGFTQDQR